MFIEICQRRFARGRQGIVRHTQDCLSQIIHRKRDLFHALAASRTQS